MSFRNESDLMPGIYKCEGNIKNLIIRVKLEIIKSSVLLLSNTDEQDTGIETKNNEVEEKDFEWQERVFSSWEIKHYKNEQNCVTPLEKEYHLQVQKYDCTVRKNLFSYTSKDEKSKKISGSILLDKHGQEYPEKVTKHLRLMENANSTNVVNLSSCKNIVDYNPSDELRARNRSLSKVYQSMYILVDLSEKNETSSENESHEIQAHTLVSINWDDVSKTLYIMPDFTSCDTPGYKIDQDILGDTRYEYRFWINHITPSTLQHEQTIFNLPMKFSYDASDFQTTKPDYLQMFVFCEIKKAVGFEYDNLFIQYFLHLSKGWKTKEEDSLCGVTHRSKSGHVMNSCVFSYLVEFKLILHLTKIQNNESDIDKFSLPQLFFEICSLDGWGRYRIEGYTWINIPNVAGKHTLTLDSWRWTSDSPVDELTRYFIGASRQIVDFTYAAIPSNFNNSKLLSKYGFKTKCSGKLHIGMNIVHQFGNIEQHANNTKSRRKSNKLLNRLAASTIMNNVAAVLEAFKKARQRMITARQPYAFVDYHQAVEDSEFDKEK